jgi:glutaredoxin 2
MQVTLYHYVHCPFCVRVRMAFGHLGINYKSEVLQYDDEKTPVDLTSVKMLPIATIDSRTLNESLDIIKLADKENKLDLDFLDSKEFIELEATINFLAKEVHNLAMPYWVLTPEFQAPAKKYFEDKKSKKRGPFKELVKKQPELIEELNKKLVNLEKNIKKFYLNDTFSIKDIILASHIWGMYVVPEFQFSEKIHQYLQRVKSQCNFNYHEDFWN